MGITAHWISQFWELKHLLADFIRMKGSHSGENIKEEFSKCLHELGIWEKVKI